MLDIDNLYFYIDFYSRWFPEYSKINFVNGNFLYNYRNIVLVYTLEQFKKLITASNLYFCEKDWKHALAIEDCNIIIPGAEIDGNVQYIYENDWIKVLPSGKITNRNLICLVAYRNIIKEGAQPSLDDYFYKYEICSKEELLEGNDIDIHWISGYYENEDYRYELPSIDFFVDRNRTYKSKIILPDYTDLLYLSSDGPFYSEIKTGRLCGAGSSMNNVNLSEITGIGISSFGLCDSGIRCIDIDGCYSELFLKYFLDALGLPENYKWVVNTASGLGYHVWISCKDSSQNYLINKELKHILYDFPVKGVINFLPNKKFKYSFKNIELRCGEFCMLPPSIGANGKAYTFKNGLPEEGFYHVEEGLLYNVLNNVSNITSIDHKSLLTHGFLWSDGDITYPIFMCFDTETTGLPLDNNKSFFDINNWPRIVQISFSLFRFLHNNVEIDYQKDYVIAPEDFVIPLESTKVHGINQKDALSKGFSMEDVLLYIADQLQYVDYIVCHNVDFDINVLRSEFLRFGIDVSKQFTHIKTICTMKSGARLFPKEKNWPKLEDLYLYLTGEKMQGAHNALNDVNATIKCFEKLIQRGIIHVEQQLYCSDLDKDSNSW